MINTDQPLVSVLLPVFNAEKFLADSIQSILSQSYTNFELIILNDGSTDRSAQIISSFIDPRIRYFEHTNIGLANTLNKGINLANGKYIARQDNDDLSRPERLALQVDYLETHPEIAVLGSCANIIDENDCNTGRKHLHPTLPSHLKFEVIFDNPFVHSSVIFRKNAIAEIGLYDPRNDFFEDHNLWSRFSYKFELANLHNILLDYREVNSGMSKSSSTYQLRVINQTVLNLMYYLPSEDKSNLMSLANYYHTGNLANIDLVWFKSKIKYLLGLIFKDETSLIRKVAEEKFFLKMSLNHIRIKLSRPKNSAASIILLKIKRRIVLNRLNKLILSHKF